MIEYVVSPAENGFRADKIVVNAFVDVSYTFLQKIFRTKKVKVNEKVAHASDRLKTGDIIKIFARKAAPSIRKDTQAKNDDTQVKMNLKSAEKFKQMIIFENNDFIAINKPTNLAVQKGSKVKICVEELMSAIKAAHLEEMISELPEGLDTELGERGLTLSGGQRQRVAIARAMLRNAPIVILDEATSALDNESEAIVQKAMDNLMKDRTVFIIAHRLSTIKNADRIAVINEGELVELGTHEELMNIENGQYKALYEMQFKKQEVNV